MGCTQLRTADLCCARVSVCVMQHRRALHTTKEEMQRLCSLKDNTQRDREIEGAWLYNFFFPWMFSPSTLCLCRPELFILHKKKKKCEGIQGQSKRRELSVRYTSDTHTHIHISGHHLLPTHASRNVYMLGIHANTHARAHVSCEDGRKVQKGGALEERHRKREGGWCFFRRKEINVRKRIDWPAQWAVREQKNKTKHGLGKRAVWQIDM